MILSFVVFLVVIGIVTYYTYQYMKPKTQSNTLYELSAPSTKVISHDDLPWNMTTPSSLRFAVYISLSPKTVLNINCANAMDTNRLSQTCSDYSFTSCTCDSRNNCRNCTPDTYLTPLLSLGNSVNFLVSGYVSQSDKPLVSSLITIKTTSSSSTHIESISLPAIPLQKWTVVTLVQEGRRIDVFYGTDSVASTYLKYTPIPAYATDSWKVGGMNGWGGKIGLFSSSLSRKSSEDVIKDVTELVDSTGLPYGVIETDVPFFDISLLSLPSCIFGTCSGLPPIKAPNPFSVYSSSVS